MKDEILAQAQMIPHDIMHAFEDTWFVMPNWKWLVLAAALVLGLMLMPVLRYGLKKFRQALRGKREATRLTQYLLDLPLERTWSWILLCLLWLTVIDNLALPEKMGKYLTLLVQIILAFSIIRLLYLSIDALGRLFRNMAARTETTLDDQLAPFATKTLKVAVVVLGALIALQNFGVNVVSILAGLGLGGLALALAAQDTAANLFGSITILFDGPFKIGDWIKVGSTEGTVEEIGFRSTRIRTFYNSLITVPNSVIAKELIDNMGERPRRRVRQTLGLLYETPPEKITEFTDAVHYALKQEPKVDHPTISATFKNFSAASLDIQVTFHLLDIKDNSEEESVTQKIFVEFLQIAQKIGVEYAYPTQTLHVKGTGGTLPTPR